MILFFALACTPEPVARPPLDAPSVEARWSAFLALDLDELRAAAPQILARMHDEPDPALRREIVRQAGATNNPAVRAELVRLAGGPESAAAIESLGYDRPEGCAILADLYVDTARGGAHADETRHPHVQRALITAPECGDALRVRMPGIGPMLSSATENVLNFEKVPRDANTRAELEHARYALVRVTGTVVSEDPLVLRLSDGAEVVVTSSQVEAQGENRVVVGVSVPVVAGEPDKRLRIVRGRFTEG